MARPLSAPKDPKAEAQYLDLFENKAGGLRVPRIQRDDALTWIFFPPPADWEALSATRIRCGDCKRNGRH